MKKIARTLTLMIAIPVVLVILFLALPLIFVLILLVILFTGGTVYRISDTRGRGKHYKDIRPGPAPDDDSIDVSWEDAGEPEDKEDKKLNT
jgi:hypothetical protein